MTEQTFTSFSAVERELLNAPATWIPALLRALIKAATKRQVFQPGGLVIFVRAAEEDAKR